MFQLNERGEAMSMFGGGGMRGGKGAGAPGAGKGGAPRVGGGPAAPTKRAPAAAAEKGVTQVTEREFEQEVLRSETPVLIEFSAAWCGPCKTIAPEVEAFAQEMRGKVRVVKIDIDQSPLIARQLRVQSVPTFMLFAQGRIVDAVVGAIRKKQMHDMVEPYLPRAEGALKPRELAELMKRKAAAPVDTREPSAYARARIPGAKNLPLEQIEGRLAELFMLPGQPVLYCRSGEKTKEMATKLAEQGATVAFLEGGFLGWESDGLPVEK
jgi:thioredoxin 1/putative thioredoxin